jgi:hypothetical protein
MAALNDDCGVPCERSRISTGSSSTRQRVPQRDHHRLEGVAEVLGPVVTIVYLATEWPRLDVGGLDELRRLDRKPPADLARDHRSAGPGSLADEAARRSGLHRRLRRRGRVARAGRPAPHRGGPRPPHAQGDRRRSAGHGQRDARHQRQRRRRARPRSEPRRPPTPLSTCRGGTSRQRATC